MSNIPRVLHEHIHGALASGNVVLIGTVLPTGYAQVTPRGSTRVFDAEHVATWERGRGSTQKNLTDGAKVTIYVRKPELRQAGVRPRGGLRIKKASAC